MRATRRTITAIVGGTAVAISVGLGASAVAQPSEPPERPSWVNNDGTVDRNKMPDSVPVVGPDGKTVRNDNGDPVHVDLNEPGKRLPDKPPSSVKNEGVTQQDDNGNTIGMEVEMRRPATPER